MIILGKEQVLKLHASLIKATGGSDGIRDEGILDFRRNILWIFLILQRRHRTKKAGKLV